MIRRILLLAVAVFFAFPLASGYADNPTQGPGEGVPPGVMMADGLHITGTPIEVDIETYRLQVLGLVDTPLLLTYADVLAMESRREHMELVCPGAFVDTGHWTGVDLLEILAAAGVKDRATTVEFVAVDRSYTVRASLEDIRNGTFLVAYEYEDKPFPVYHGFPFRIAAKDKPGYVWVKWLGFIIAVP